MKKLLTFLLVATLGLALTGCFGRNSDDPNGDNNGGTNNGAENNYGQGSDELIALINAAYADVIDLPITETTAMDLNDPEMIEFVTGLTDLSNVSAVVRSDALMMTTPFTIALIQVNTDANIEAMKQEILNNIDLWKWICVAADVGYVTNFGNTIILIMAEQDLADQVYEGFRNASNSNLGTRLEKINDITDGPGGGMLDLGEIE